jgi:hypothetical protein
MKKLGLMIFALSALAAAGGAAANPKAPQNLCISDASGAKACAPAAPSPTATAKKWNPGHYLLTNEQGFPGNRAQRQAVWQKACSDPQLKGGQAHYSWGTFVRGKGEYNFAEIDADRDTLKACGKRLIIEVWYMWYWNSVPTNQRSNFDTPLPDYIVNSGCVATGDFGGFVATVDRPTCMDGLIADYQALATRYDNDPNVELVVVTETSAGYSGKNDAAFSTQTKRLLQSMAKSWTHTGIVIYANWFPNTKDLFETTLLPLGIGIGGPDIKPLSTDQDDGSCVLRGYANKGGCLADKGTTDYRGKIPVAYSYQAAVKDGPPSALIGYALDELKATHLTWVTENFSGDVNLFGWNATMAAIKSRNYVTITAYPSVWPK